MFPPFLSIVALYGSYLRRCFNAAGLASQKIDVDDQTTLHFWGPSQQSPRKKPSLVVIHGFGPMALWQWRQQVQFLAPHFDLFVPDLVFFGDSTTKSSERSEVFQAASVAKLLDKLDVERFHVMGTSYGGFVAYHLAKMSGEKVEKVVIASSGVNMRKSDNVALIERANLDKIEDLMLPATPEHLRNLMGLSVSKRLNMLPSFFLNDLINNLYSENRKEKMELLKGVTLGRDDAVNLSPLEQEVLIIWGEQDRIFPVRMATELKQVIGKKARLELIKNASHVPQIEQAGEFNKIVLDFLRGS
ncbi:hypothetical protein K1719_022395 [Acacia pycnantha]|nr:hypothetical protein K1719_022395 [Acacia pycnantha]